MIYSRLYESLSYVATVTSPAFIVCIRRRALFRDENNNLVRYEYHY